MTGPEHYAEAERLETLAFRMVDEATPNTVDERARHADFLVRAAQVHATLALVTHVREIGDQLDRRKPVALTDDDVMRCDHGAVICGLCGFGVPAGDGGRS